MRDTSDANYAVDKLQASYNEGRENGLSHADAIFAAAEEHGIDPFKVAALCRKPESERATYA